MAKVTLKAHFDGRHIQLDEPYELLPDAPLAVIVLTPKEATDREDWLRAATSGLARAYGDNEPEYSDADVKP